jgi:hypothetical protein
MQGGFETETGKQHYGLRKTKVCTAPFCFKIEPLSQDQNVS